MPDDPYAPIEAILTRWIDTAFSTATTDERDPHTLAVLAEIRNLHLAGDLTATAVAVYRAAHPSTPWEELVAATIALTESTLRFNAACARYGDVDA